MLLFDDSTKERTDFKTISPVLIINSGVLMWLDIQMVGFGISMFLSLAKGVSLSLSYHSGPGCSEAD